MKKVLIHGATNWGSSNFGDFLYAIAAIKRIHEVDSEAEIRLAEPSDYFLKYIPEYAKSDFKEAESDLVVYIPGGYFGEGHQYSLRDQIIHFIRFLPVGIRASYRKQRICVVGVGAGPISNIALKRGIKRICNCATSLTVRDAESLCALEGIGVHGARLVFDPIICLPLRDWGVHSPQLDELNLDSTKKTLLIHYNHSRMGAALFAESVNQYIKQSTEQFNIIVSSDQILATENDLFDLFCEKIEFPVFRYKYDNPYEFITLLEACDCILTCKLHVGVVGMMLGLSVVCIAEHPEKTMRFYSHVGCPERCASLYDSSSKTVFNMMQDYINAPMPSFSKKDIDLAELSWKTLDQCLGL